MVVLSIVSALEKCTHLHDNTQETIKIILSIVSALEKCTHLHDNTQETMKHKRCFVALFGCLVLGRMLAWPDTQSLFFRQSFRSLKPVLNWVNVCSLNILRTLRRTTIHFLTELLARRTWFGQCSELYFVLNWLVMRCKLRPKLAADAHPTAWLKMWAKVKSVYFNHPS